MASIKGASWAFVLGVILAIILGIIGYYVQTPVWLGWVLLILGLIVGLTNITSKEAHPFMIAGTVLVLVSYLSSGVFTGLLFIPNVLSAILMLFTPAVIIIAIREVWIMAKGK